MDKITQEKRSANMSRIRSTGSTVELALRRALRSAGIRGYRVNPTTVVGRPDVVFTRWRVAVFVDGCFWHACPACFVPPSSNTDYWDAKIARNRARDSAVTAQLENAGWRVVRLWEHEVREDADEAAMRIHAVLKQTQEG